MCVWGADLAWGGQFPEDMTSPVCVYVYGRAVPPKPNSSLFSQSQIQGPAILSLHILAQACLSLPQPSAQPCSAPQTTIPPRNHCITQGTGSEEG